MTRPPSGRIELSAVHICLAKGATFTSAWGSAPGLIGNPKEAPALKAQFTAAATPFHRRRPFGTENTCQIETRLQRLFTGHLNSWGAAPGSCDTAPLALSRYRRWSGARVSRVRQSDGLVPWRPVDRVLAIATSSFRPHQMC